MEQRLTKDAWISLALLGLSYALVALPVAAVSWLPGAWLVDLPLWQMLAVFGAAGAAAGLLAVVPALHFIKRLSLWVFPRLALDLDVGKAPRGLRLKDATRFNWSMTTGSGRAVVQHLENLRTGSPLASAAQGVGYLGDAALRDLRRSIRRARIRAHLVGFAVMVPMAGATFWVAWATAGTVAYIFAIAVLMAITMPAAMLTNWATMRLWARAYMAWVGQQRAAYQTA